VAQPAPERSIRQSARPSGPQARAAVVECVVLAVACLVTYWLATHLLTRVHSVGRDDDLLGGMWAVLATIFVLRDSFGKSVAAAVSRMSATSVSFVLCLIYLAFLPFHAWALALLVGASALVVMLLGRPGDAVTAGITTAVIMVVAAVSPQHAWQQPILRLADTIVGVAVGAIAAWVGMQLKKLLPARSAPPDLAKVKVELPERAVVRGPRSAGNPWRYCDGPPSACGPGPLGPSARLRPQPAAPPDGPDRGRDTASHGDPARSGRAHRRHRRRPAGRPPGAAAGPRPAGGRAQGHRCPAPGGTGGRWPAVVTCLFVILLLLGSSALVRRALDRRRLNAWDADWQATGPRWSSRPG
jgi:Fusaric acid resistance protein-like